MTLRELSDSLRGDGWRWTCRKLWDWMTADHDDGTGWVPFEDRPAPPYRPRHDLIGYIEAGQHPPDLSDHERLMRHTGRPECPIPEHTDALRLLGQARMELDTTTRRVALLEATNNRQRREIEYLQCRINHPARGGQQDAA